MRCIIQRVKKASVKTKNAENSINQGLLVFTAALDTDTDKDILKISQKIQKMRIFDDDNKVMNLSIMDVKGEILLIPQFTLYAELKKGNRPYYGLAASPAKARQLINKLRESLTSNVPVKEGFFGKEMDISSVNHGPVTIIIDTEEI